MFEKENTPFKIAVYGVFMLILYLLQSVPALGIRYMGASPELLLTLAVCVAFFESETFSAFFGLAAGLLNDVIAGGIIGKSGIIFMFTAFFVSVLLQTMFRNMFLTYIAMVLTVTAGVLLIEYVFTALFFDAPPFGYALRRVMIPKLLLTGVLAYPVHFVVKRLCRLSVRGDAK